MEEKKKIDKGTLIYRSVVIILIAMFVVIFVYGLNKVLAMEGTLPPVINEEGVVAAPETALQGAELLNETFKKASELSPKVQRKDSISVDEDEIEVSSTDEMKLTLAFLADGFEDKIEDSFDEEETDYGEKFKANIMAPHLEAGDIIEHTFYYCETCGKTSDEMKESCDECGSEEPYKQDAQQVKCSYIYYTCRSCGKKSDVPKDECETCGSVYPYIERYSDEYEVTLYVDESILGKTFDPMTKEEALAVIADEIEGRLTVKDFDVKYDELRIFYKVERLTKRLTYLEYCREMTVTADVSFEGELASLGEQTFTFPLTEKNKFTFTWPNVELNKHEMSVEPGSTDNLLATLTCADPATQSVIWSSSDENVLTIDEEGYIKAGKEAGTAIVTAEMMFMGERYSDCCTVNVRHSVESISISDRKITVNQGETFTLTATPAPKKATVKTVTWYTEDENIAWVNSDGEVIGASKGVTHVYALSDDGYYKTSCEVTVI